MKQRALLTATSVLPVLVILLFDGIFHASSTVALRQYPVMSISSSAGKASPKILSSRAQLGDLLSRVDKGGPSTKSPWAFALQKHVSSPLASKGVWIIHEHDDASFASVMHVIPHEANNNVRKVSLWRIFLWCLTSVPPKKSSSLPSGPTAPKDICHEAASLTTKLAAKHIAESVSSPQGTNRQLVKISFAALDGTLTQAVERTLSDSTLGMKLDAIYPCGLYTYDFPAPPQDREPFETQPHRLPSGARIRRLTQADAELVDSRWEYRSAASPSLIRTLISLNSPCCLGVEVDGNLCAWVLQYHDHRLGILWCEEGHRRRGYAEALVSRAMHELGQAGETQVQACVVDGNRGSEKLFRKLEWNRACSANWVSFVSATTSGDDDN